MNAAGASAIGNVARRNDYLILAALTSAISVCAFWFYYTQGSTLLYGDAVAHLNIARRVFDSQTPGFFQLGTVWLPLPHLITIPFIANDWLWKNGIGASIPSLLAYIAGTLGVFRLVRALCSRTAAWIASAIYALNPNLIYIQSTGMTESLYLALIIWTIVFFADFIQFARENPDRARRSLDGCALVLCAAMMVRYDGWFLAAVLSVALVIFLFHLRDASRPLLRSAIGFMLLTFLTACLWLAYNHVHYGNALEFGNGPYSAGAIQQRSRTATMQTYPGEHSARTAALYFLKVTGLNLGEGGTDKLLLAAAFIALLAILYFSRRFWPWMLLWTPLVFYIICIGWGSVPIYLPEWWPFSYYNVRYGLQLLPAVAVFTAAGYELLRNFLPGRLIATGAAVIIAVSYGSVWWHTPICLREAEVNGSVRLKFDHQLATELERLEKKTTILMDCSAHPGAAEIAGVPFRRVLRESNPPYWEMALTRPAQSADYVVAIDGDDVWRAVRLFPQGLQPVAIVGTLPGPRAVVYKSVR
jgi:hypothetical protein